MKAGEKWTVIGLGWQWGDGSWSRSTDFSSLPRKVLLSLVDPLGSTDLHKRRLSFQYPHLPKSGVLERRNKLDPDS